MVHAKGCRAGFCGVWLFVEVLAENETWQDGQTDRQRGCESQDLETGEGSRGMKMQREGGESMTEGEKNKRRQWNRG